MKSPGVLFFMLLVFISSCSETQLFDTRKALQKNKVKSYTKKQYRFENGKRILILTSVSNLDSKGRVTSDSTVLSYNDVKTSLSIKKYFYNKFNLPDSVQMKWYSSDQIERNIFLFYYSLFGQLDSTTNMDLVNDHWVRQGFRFVYSYPQSGVEIEEEYNNNKLIEKTIATYDGGGKLINTERTTIDPITSNQKNNLVKTFNYQYDSQGKKLSLEVENPGEKGIYHYYEYYKNDLVKQVAIISQNGDTSYLTTYEYRYRKD